TSCCRHVHQNCGNPCSISTSGPVPISATCIAMPFARTVRCVHGPSRRTDESSIGRLSAVGENGETLLAGCDGAFRSPQPLYVAAAEKDKHADNHEQDPEHDQVRRPPPDASRN